MKTKLFSPVLDGIGSTWRSLVVTAAGATLLGLGLAGPGANKAAGAATSAVGKTMHISLLPTLASPQEPVLAQINGQKLSAGAFNKTLTQLYGMHLFSQWVQVTLLQQACAKEGIHVGKGVVDAEEEKILQRLSAEHVPQGQRHAALARVLAMRGKTVPQFRLELWRSAYVKALAKGHIHVTKKQIQEAYNINFGPKVKAVDIVVGSIRDAVTVRHLIMKENKNPEQVARAMSLDQQTAQNGGVVLIPLDNPTLPKVLLHTAARLTPGKLSPSIPINGEFHLLWLLEKIPAQKVSMNKVRPIIVKKISQALVNQWGQREIARLWQAAKIKIDNPILQQQYAALRAAALAQAARNKAAQQKAAKGSQAKPKTPAAQ